MVHLRILDMALEKSTEIGRGQLVAGQTKGKLCFIVHIRQGPV